MAGNRNELKIEILQMSANDIQKNINEHMDIVEELCAKFAETMNEINNLGGSVPVPAMDVDPNTDTPGDVLQRIGASIRQQKTSQPLDLPSSSHVPAAQHDAAAAADNLMAFGDSEEIWGRMATARAVANNPDGGDVKTGLPK
jgi:hypothetical protein